MRALIRAGRWWFACHQDATRMTLTTSAVTHWAGLQVLVPPLGESITDGTIASILKQPGDSVEEDEPLLQIETDKVTIDVRSPQTGTVEAILVKEEDTVTVGHVVASIADRTSEEGRQRKTTSNTSPLASQTDSDTDKHRQTQQSTSVTDHAAPQEEMQARVPSISFPPRRTPQGEVISLLPAGQAAEYTHSVANSSSPPPPAAAAATAQTSPIRSAPEPPRLYIRVPPRDGAAVTRPSALRKELSDREIEAIMLGGIND